MLNTAPVGERILDMYLAMGEPEEGTRRGERAITIYYCPTQEWVHAVESEVQQNGGSFVAIGGVANTLAGDDTIEDYILAAMRRVGIDNVCVFTAIPTEFVLPEERLAELLSKEQMS